MLLSGKSLAQIGEELGVNKLMGDLDYEKIRTPVTPLTNEELNYCLRDTEIVVLFIRKKLTQYGNICEIPLTITGEVRHYCKQQLLVDDVCVYHEHIKRCYPNKEVFELLFKAFAGGYTHANALYVDEVMEDIKSFDFTSSYPAVMLLEKFPTKFKKFKINNIEVFNSFVKKKACLFNITFTKIRAKTLHHTISRHKCNCKGYLSCDNGRVIECDELTTTMTDVDYKMLVKFYDFDNMRINKFFYADYEYLPTPFLKCILELYNDKTQLKGVKGEEDLYLLRKGNLNSLYGMCVTNPVKGQIQLVDDEYIEEEIDIDTTLERQAKNKKTYLLYQWGVWVTAYARSNLLEGILEFGNDCVYSDTDSIKALNADKHIEYINNYNATIETRLKDVAIRIGVPFDQFEPKDIKGIKHMIGVWDYEGEYRYFKTLGAKRYMYLQGEDYHITVAGLPKVAIKYISKQEKPFDYFTDEMFIPEDESNKNTHTYIDEVREGKVVDYLGTPYCYSQRSGIHIGKAPFRCNIIQEFLDLINGVSVSEYSGKPFIDKSLNPSLKTTLFT